MPSSGSRPRSPHLRRVTWWRSSAGANAASAANNELQCTREGPMTSRRTAILAGLGSLLRAQVAIDPRQKPAPPKQEPTGTTLRADTNLVLIPVTVNDPLNRPVTGLEKEHFRVFDD